MFLSIFEGAIPPLRKIGFDYSIENFIAHLLRKKNQ